MSRYGFRREAVSGHIRQTANNVSVDLCQHVQRPPAELNINDRWLGYSLTMNALFLCSKKSWCQHLKQDHLGREPRGTGLRLYIRYEVEQTFRFKHCDQFISCRPVNDIFRQTSRVTKILDNLHGPSMRKTDVTMIFHRKGTRCLDLWPKSSTHCCVNPAAESDPRTPKGAFSDNLLEISLLLTFPRYANNRSVVDLTFQL